MSPDTLIPALKSACNDLDDNPTVTSFTSAAYINKVLLSKTDDVVDSTWFITVVLYVLMAINLDCFTESVLLFYWTCFFSLALHFQFLITCCDASFVISYSQIE